MTEPACGKTALMLIYRKDLDGLRALAVGGVVFFHLFPRLVPGGYVGVDVFFVLSGFLISWIIWDLLDAGRFDVRSFYSRRVLRLFPALILVLAAVWLCGVFLLSWDERALLGKHITASALYLNNILLWSEGGYFDPAAESKPLLHLWSLSIEEQFYLVWPLILYVSSKNRCRLYVALACSSALPMALCLILASTVPFATFYNPACRWWELSLGALVAHLVRTGSALRGRVGHAASLLGLALILWSMSFLSRDTTFPGVWTLVPTIGAALLIACLPTSIANATVLSFRGFVFIGLISYPLYLWHWPIYSFAHMHTLGQLEWAQRLAIVALSVVLAWITHRYVDGYFRTGARSRVTVCALVCAVGALGGLGAYTHQQRGFVGSAEITLTAPYLLHERPLDVWLNDVRAGPCHWQTNDHGRRGEECVERKRPLVLLWGDSHAAALYPGLRQLQASRSFGIVQMTQAACPPMPKVQSKLLSGCDSINDEVLDFIASKKPETIIIHSAYIHQNFSLASADVVTAIEETLQAIGKRSGDSKVVVVGPVPRWIPSLQTALSQYVERHHRPAPRYLEPPRGPDMESLRQIDHQLRLLQFPKNVFYVSAFDVFCLGDSCLTRLSENVDGLYSFDGGHLNPETATYLITTIQDRIL